MKILVLICAVLVLSSCSFPGVYRIDIPQGNIITQEMVDQLRPGLTKRQVNFIMGTPLIRDTFDLRSVWTAIEHLDNKVPAALQTAEAALAHGGIGDEIDGGFGDHRQGALAAGHEGRDVEPALRAADRQPEGALQPAGPGAGVPGCRRVRRCVPLPDHADCRFAAIGRVAPLRRPS